MAVLFLGEKIGLRRVLSVIAGFAGALVIVSRNPIFTPASLLPLGAAIFIPAVPF